MNYKILILLLLPIIVCCTAASALTYQEAPMLAERVEKGELPPVEERLPKEPVVVEPVESIGKYGGTWRRLAIVINDLGLSTRLGYEHLVRWDRSGKNVAPGLARSWEILDDGKTYVFHLRKGVRWSDGHPLTSEDFVFHFEDVLQNKELFPIFPAIATGLVIDGEMAEVRAPDPYTVEYHLPKPNALFLQLLAFRGSQQNFFSPAHYLKQFLPKYGDTEEIERLTREHGFKKWSQFVDTRIDILQNPDLPVVNPFVLKVGFPASRCIAERNPYYWKVDPEGKQLPYIDRISYGVLQNPEILNFKAMTGGVDFQARYIELANYSLFMENREAGNYRVQRDQGIMPIVVYLNHHSKDEEIREVLQDKRFRVALSVALNRRELIDVIYSGMAVPSSGVASPLDPHHLPEFEKKYLEYNPDHSRDLLDAVGLKADSTGMRSLPSGKPFRRILNIYPSEAGGNLEMWQLVADYWREVGLDFVVKRDSASLTYIQAQNGEIDFLGYLNIGLHWVIDPGWYVPTTTGTRYAPLYGQYVYTDGKRGVKPPPEFQRLLEWFYKLRSEVDAPDRRLELGRNILKQWANECYCIGICRNEVLTIISNRFRNVPEEIIHSYRVKTPGYIGIEQFYIDE